MSLKNKDLKKLWARSGNVCSFPECQVELVREKKANRVIGEEAHIKGEKPKAPRYDPSQTEAERESYENRILLCPTHHTEIDSDEQTWTVERLLKMKANHERQVIKNRQFPEFLSKVAKLLQAYQINDEPLDFSVSEVVESTDSVTIRIDASKEGGVNTTLQVKVGQRIAFFARGLITYDGGYGFANPEGIICNEYGLPFSLKDSVSDSDFVIFLHPEALKTDGGESGRIGSLIGWVNQYTEQDAFFIGAKREIEIKADGELYLLINDAVGTYDDNNGEFRVEIKII